MQSNSTESSAIIEEYLVTVKHEQETWRSLSKEAKEKRKYLKRELKHMTPISADHKILGEMYDEYMRNRVNTGDVINKIESFQKNVNSVKVQVSDYQREVQLHLNRFEERIDTLINATVDNLIPTKLTY